MDAFAAFGVALGVAFVAELGDKSQLILFGQAARGHPVRVVLEASAAFALLTAFAVTVGATLGPWIPAVWTALVSAALFFLFAWQAWRESRKTDAEVQARKPRGTFLLILVAEFGDRTQIVTAALALSSGQVVATGLGAWVALTLSSVLAVAAGSWLGHRIDARRRALFSAILFGVLGLASLGWATFLVF